MFGISSFWKGIDLVIVELHFIIAIETKRFSFFYYILSYMYVYISTWGYVHMDVCYISLEPEPWAALNCLTWMLSTELRFSATCLAPRHRSALDRVSLCKSAGCTGTL